jgi:hypothetical protein
MASLYLQKLTLNKRYRLYKYMMNPRYVFGKARGRKPYCHTSTSDNTAQKHYPGFFRRSEIRIGCQSMINLISSAK